MGEPAVFCEYMQTQRIKILGKDAIPTNNSSCKTDPRSAVWFLAKEQDS